MRRYKAVVEMSLRTPYSERLVVEVEAENCQVLAKDVVECLQLIQSGLAKAHPTLIGLMFRIFQGVKAVIDRASILRRTWRGRK